jgi:hypothetical protein
MKTAVMLTDKTNADLVIGWLYFKDDKVVGLARDRDWTPDDASHKSGIAFFRLVTEITQGKTVPATIRTSTLEAYNGTARRIVISFSDGRHVKLETIEPDPGQKFAAGTAVSECLGTCSDW